MNIMWLLIWAAAVTAVTLAGSWYARRSNRPDLLIALYVTFVLVAQVLAAKVAEFDLGALGTWTGPAGAIVFAVTFLMTDIVNEKFGRRETHRMIMIAFVTQLAMVLFFWLGTSLPAASFWPLQEPWEAIFGLVPRITLASWVAFLISENFDAWVFDRFKRLTKGRHLWLRNVVSSLPALALDSLIFVPIAFLGVMPLGPVILGQVAVKWLVGLVGIPFMYLNRAVLYKEAGQGGPNQA
jgi:uncharacterized integral membrane protein (TIGR00697 family)